jgi:arylsulfatase A-like enzyme
VVLAALLLALCQSAPTKDVLVITWDDVGAEAVEDFNLPGIHALAAQGVTIPYAVAMPNCSPARYAAMTGRWPRRDGIGSTVDSLDPATSVAPQPPRGWTSLAHVLKGRGYRTCAVGKWHLGLGGAEDQAGTSPHLAGFDDTLALTPVGVGAHDETYSSWLRCDQGVCALTGEYPTDAQADAFIQWWVSTPSPKFCWLAFNAAHPPLHSPPGQVDPLLGRDRFRQMAEYLDAATADCLSVVDLGSTVVTILSDNGTPKAARPPGTLSDHWKGTTFEGGIRVFMAAAGPGIPAGMTSSALVSVVDLPRLVADRVGISLPASFCDSLPLGSRQWALAERFQEGIDDLCIIEGDWKLRVFDATGTGSYVEAMYDLANDPGELSPMSPSSPTAAGPYNVLSAHLTDLPLRLP